MKRYTNVGLWQLKKVTKFFAIVALCLLIVALGFVAKHGQFESSAEHGRFLSKSVKMEYASHCSDAAMNCDATPVVMHLEVLFLIQPPSITNFGVTPPKTLSLPLLV